METGQIKTTGGCEVCYIEGRRKVPRGSMHHSPCRDDLAEWGPSQYNSPEKAANRRTEARKARAVANPKTLKEYHQLAHRMATELGCTVRTAINYMGPFRDRKPTGA